MSTNILTDIQTLAESQSHQFKALDWNWNWNWTSAWLFIENCDRRECRSDWDAQKLLVIFIFIINMNPTSLHLISDTQQINMSVINTSADLIQISETQTGPGTGSDRMRTNRPEPEQVEPGHGGPETSPNHPWDCSRTPGAPQSSPGPTRSPWTPPDSL